VLNSMGARFYEGRKIFDETFAVITALFKHRKVAPLIAVAEQTCLGLCGPMFQMAHYRLKPQGKTHYHLTGAKVQEIFFAESNNFDSMADMDAYSQSEYLVHQQGACLSDTFYEISQLLLAGKGCAPTTEHNLVNLPSSPMRIRSTAQALLSTLGKSSLELFRCYDTRLNIYIVQTSLGPVGVFLQPPWNPHNMIGSKTLQKYDAALVLFEALQLPIVSFVDNPGIDPHPYADGKQSMIPLVTQVCERIIFYPFPKISVIVGRAYGGGATLGFPKCFGGSKVYALKGCQMGVMSHAIIDSLLEGAGRLREEWQDAKLEETPGLEDLIECGTIDAVVTMEELPALFHDFLSQVRRENQ
jgi:Carboxyl transferase domain